MLLMASQATAMNLETLPTDKAAHFGLSSVAVEATMKTCQAMEGSSGISPACRGWSSGFVLTAGLLKEISDRQRGREFDQQDLVANVLGVITGNLLQWNF
ncbi:hypothetical protein [Oligoflexus tunisiensis]|uniref:hypothetical protein n=1 Tax=Oligoflexus tunisiensis TaxID=708132 RepID=UPI00114CE11A|nr:hypothetical protein [Oligoflexus tunisiensis]